MSVDFAWLILWEKLRKGIAEETERDANENKEFCEGPTGKGRQRGYQTRHLGQQEARVLAFQLENRKMKAILVLEESVLVGWDLGLGGAEGYPGSRAKNVETHSRPSLMKMNHGYWLVKKNHLARCR